MKFGKLVLLCSFFITFKSLATELKVPAFMNGVLADKKVLKGDFFVYDVGGKFEPSSITPAKTSNQTVEELLSSLYYAYSNNDRDHFFKLFSPDALKQLKSLPADQFDGMWKAYSSRKEPILLFYHDHKNGVLIGVKGKGEKNPDIQFARKIGSSWVFDKAAIDDNDPRTNNVGLYVTYLPMIASKASLLTTFKRDDKSKILEAQVTQPYLALLTKTKDRWELIGQVKDNDAEYSAWPDTNPNPGLIKIQVELEVTESNSNAEILVIESSYPLSYFPLSLEVNGQFTY